MYWFLKFIGINMLKNAITLLKHETGLIILVRMNELTYYCCLIYDPNSKSEN